jgi:integrase
MKEKLTDRYVSKFQRSPEYPPPKRLVIYDTDIKGFCLVAQPSGSMSLVLRYRRRSDGISCEFKIGLAGSISIAAARKMARAKSGEVYGGKDIQRARQDAKAKAEHDRLQTLAAFFEEKYRPYCESEMRNGKGQLGSIEAHFVRRWPNVSLKDLHTFKVQGWRREKVSEGLSPAGINRPASALKAMLNRAVEWRVIDVNPLSSLKPLKEDTGKNVRFLSENEEQRLRRALLERENGRRRERDRHNVWLTERSRESKPTLLGIEFTDYLQPLVLLAINTGMRRGELFNLRIDDIELAFGSRSEGRVIVRGGGSKSGNSRNIPLTNEARRTLTTWIQQTQPAGLVFPSPVTGQRFNNINSAWARLMITASIEGFRFHDLRHTFASKLAMRGVDLYTIKEFLGHASIETTQRYAHLAPDYKSNAIAILND